MRSQDRGFPEMCCKISKKTIIAIELVDSDNEDTNYAVSTIHRMEKPEKNTVCEVIGKIYHAFAQ